MPMEDLNERQIQILRLLAGQTEPLRNPELARRFGCSIKTIQRDFKRIEILGCRWDIRSYAQSWNCAGLRAMRIAAD